MNRRFWIIIALIVTIGAALRIAGLFDDMWLDEIWSYDLATQVHRIGDILLAPDLRLDNNHPINTLWLWLAGFHTNWVIYRIPSILFGIAGLIYFPFIAARRGRQVAIIATLLFSLSHPLTFFCSEARGYAMLIFFSLLAFDGADRYLTKPSWLSAFQFMLGCALALLSHLTFIFLYGGLVAWTTFHLIRSSTRPASDLLRLHLIPFLFTIFLYFIFGRYVAIGGGPPVRRMEAFATAAASLVAIRGPYYLELAVTFLVAALCIWAIVGLARRGCDLWVLLLTGIFVAPIPVFIRQAMVLDHPQPIQPRYFLVLLPFLILGVSILLPSILKKQSIRLIPISIITVFLVANVWETRLWLKFGRGHYSDAIAYMARETDDHRITVISDNYLRTTTLLDFYSRRLLPAGRELVVLDGEQPIPADIGPPRWAIRAFDVRGSPPQPWYRDPRDGSKYVYDRELTYYGLSGYSWYLYRRSD